MREKWGIVALLAMPAQCWFSRRREKQHFPEGLGQENHRNLAPVQIDLAAACTDSGKLSRKCEYPP